MTQLDTLLAKLKITYTNYRQTKAAMLAAVGEKTERGELVYYSDLPEFAPNVDANNEFVEAAEKLGAYLVEQE